MSDESKPRIAKRIDVSKRPGECKLLIDGEEFPYHTTEGIRTDVRRGSFPSITITLLADEIHIEDHGG